MADAPARTAWSELLWQAWGSLGVASWTREGIDTVIDPEALVVLTLLIGEDRLVLETIDWAILHVPVLNVSRLRFLAREVGAVEQAERWLATLAAHVTTAWSPRTVDVHAGFTPSGKSRRVPASGAPGVALRLRAVAGASTRAEVIRALHPNALGFEGGQSTRDIARRVGATVAQVRGVLDELVRADLVRREGTERRRVYAVPVRSQDPLLAGIWLPWRRLAWGPWRDVAIVGSALTAIDVAVQRPGPAGVVAALDAHAAVRGAIERSLPDLAADAPTGCIDVVRDALDSWSRDVAARFIEQLRTGVRGGDAVDPGSSNARSSRVASDNPWRMNASWLTRRGAPE